MKNLKWEYIVFFSMDNKSWDTYDPKKKNNLDEKTQILNPSFKIKITIFERKNTDIKTSLKSGTYLIKNIWFAEAVVL